jgi:RNA polymerase sigma-70 factor (ECF subfamily)
MPAHTLTSSPLSQPVDDERQSLIYAYERYNSELFRYAYRFLGDADLAEDCVAETFYRWLKAMQEGMGAVGYVRAYLYRVAHNWISDYYRSQPHRLVPLEAELHGEASANPAQLFSEALERQRVRAALLHLPADQQQVIMLRFVENRTHDEVAALLGKTTEATRTLQHRAITSLRQVLLLEEAGFTSPPPTRQIKAPAAAPTGTGRLVDRPGLHI